MLNLVGHMLPSSMHLPDSSPFACTDNFQFSQCVIPSSTHILNWCQGHSNACIMKSSSARTIYAISLWVPAGVWFDSGTSEPAQLLKTLYWREGVNNRRYIEWNSSHVPVKYWFGSGLYVMKVVSNIYNWFCYSTWISRSIPAAPICIHHKTKEGFQWFNAAYLEFRFHHTWSRY